MKKIRRWCKDCWKMFLTSPHSHSTRCAPCRKLFKKAYIIKWKANNKDRVRLHDRKYKEKNKKQPACLIKNKSQLGTLQPQDIAIKEGHIQGYIKLKRQMKRFV